jgi:hypothetical protein
MLAAAKPQAGNRDPQIGTFGRQIARFIELASRISQLPLRARPFRFREQRRKTRAVSSLGVSTRLRGTLTPARCQEQR